MAFRIPAKNDKKRQLAATPLTNKTSCDIVVNCTSIPAIHGFTMEKGNQKIPSFSAIVQCFVYKIKSESFPCMYG